MLVSASGLPKQQLALRERKSIATDRVILVPGPPHELQTVKDIYRMYISDKRSLCAIARKLNNKGVPRPGHSEWDFSAVRMILTHPKYVGCAVFGQVSKKLNTPAVKVPKSEWILRPGAFEPVIDPATFAEAQKVFGVHRCQPGWGLFRESTPPAANKSYWASASGEISTYEDSSFRAHVAYCNSDTSRPLV
jgi:Recombinase